MYHPNGIFSSPITATPAAEPMIKTDPPVPAQYARKFQNKPSCAKNVSGAKSYIPITAATMGTLSTIALKTPIKLPTI